MQLSDAQINEYRRLKDSGVDVTDEHVIQPHSGDETAIHYHAKCASALIGKQHGYIANCECPVDTNDSPNNNNEIDCLLWGHPDRLSYAVEIEHSPTKEVKREKLNKYVKQTAVDELVFINANELPMDMAELHETIRQELGL